MKCGGSVRGDVRSREMCHPPSLSRPHSLPHLAELPRGMCPPPPLPHTHLAELPKELILLLKLLSMLPMRLPIVVPSPRPIPPSYLASKASSMTARNRDTQMYLPAVQERYVSGGCRQ